MSEQNNDDKIELSKKSVVGMFIGLCAVVVVLVIAVLILVLFRGNGDRDSGSTPVPDKPAAVKSADDDEDTENEEDAEDETAEDEDTADDAEDEPEEETKSEKNKDKNEDKTEEKKETKKNTTAGNEDYPSADTVGEYAKDKSDKSEDKSKDEDKKKEEKDSDPYTFYYSGDNTWADGDITMTGMEMSVKNASGEALKNWKLELEIDGLSRCDGWNGTYTCKGNTLTITPADYNKDISNGSATEGLGCNIGTKGTLNVKSAKISGHECVIKKGSVPKSNNNNNNNNGQASVDVTSLLRRSSKAKQGDDWLHTDGNRILDKDGKQVWLTGVNWFGYNTGTNTFDGLWTSVLTESVDAIADHGFNLIRVPFSAELINQWADGEYPRANYNNAYNEELNSMNSLEIFDYFLKLAEENGLKVMIDIHSANTDAAGHNANLWYTDRVSVKEYYAALEWMADRYKDNDTIIAYDLKNEPHGKPNEGSSAAKWDDSKDSNNWKYVAETAAGKVLAKNPNVLIMVEGTETQPKKKGNYTSNSDDYYFNWWGGNLRGAKDYPIDLGDYQDKLVYSPHDYGPTVYRQPWFEGDYDYDSLMDDCWRDNWFYLYEDKTAPLLIGEWGGFMSEPNITWMTHMRTLISKYHLNHTFWCFNANSGDTGGLVKDDFKTWDDEKYNFVKKVLWQEDGKFVGLDHAVPLGDNGITLTKAGGL